MATMCDGDYSEVAIRLFILAINIGPKSAHKCLQRALVSCGEELDIDGIIGGHTKQLLLSNGHRIIFPFRSEAASFYRSLVAGRPELKPFLKGWLDRAYS
jgi:lysozyme family protein